MPYLSTLEVCSRQGAIQIHVYLYLHLYLYSRKLSTKKLLAFRLPNNEHNAQYSHHRRFADLRPWQRWGRWNSTKCCYALDRFDLPLCHRKCSKHSFCISHTTFTIRTTRFSEPFHFKFRFVLHFNHGANRQFRLNIGGSITTFFLSLTIFIVSCFHFVHTSLINCAVWSRYCFTVCLCVCQSVCVCLSMQSLYVCAKMNYGTSETDASRYYSEPQKWLVFSYSS